MTGSTIHADDYITRMVRLEERELMAESIENRVGIFMSRVYKHWQFSAPPPKNDMKLIMKEGEKDISTRS